MAAPVTPALGAALRSVVGASGVRDDADALAAAAVDGSVPRWVVRVTAVEQVAGVLALAHDAGLAVVPRGGGHALTLGAPPVRVDLVLDLTGLTRIVEDRPEDLVVSAETGLTAGTLASRLHPRGQRLPVDPPGWAGRTLGGLVATNSHGPLRARYGTLRDLVLGVRFVLADGVVTWGGAKVVKSVSGYDVPKLLVGSLGTLGVLVEVALRLHPLPETEASWLCQCPSPGHAEDLLWALMDAPLEPHRVEYLNQAALRACELDPAPAALAVTFGSVAEAMVEQGTRLATLAASVGATVVPAPRDLWARYDLAFVPAEGDVVLQVGTVPGQVAATVTAVEAIHRELGSGADPMVAGVGTVGALRVTLAGAEAEDAARVVERLREKVASVEGSVVVAASPRAVRERVDPWGPMPTPVLDLMRALKDEFDPRRVLNPGRYVGGL